MAMKKFGPSYLPDTDYFEEAALWAARMRASQGGRFQWNIASDSTEAVPVEDLKDERLIAWYKKMVDYDFHLRRTKLDANRAPLDEKRIQVNVGLEELTKEMVRRGIVIIDTYVFD